MMRQEEHGSICRVCKVLEISRSEYYRKVNQMRDYHSLERKASASVPQTWRQGATEVLTKKYPQYGHRKVHALLKREGFTMNRYQVYILLKRKNLLLSSTWRKDLRERSKALKEYLVKPTKPSELLQADITHVPVEGYGTYYVIDIINYYSKYVLVTLWFATHDAAALITACVSALERSAATGNTIARENQTLNRQWTGNDLEEIFDIYRNKSVSASAHWQSSPANQRLH